MTLEYMAGEYKQRSRAQVKRTLAGAIALMAGSFGFLIAGAVLHGRGISGAGITAALIAAFALCDVIAVVMLVRITGDALMYDAEDKRRRYAATELAALHDLSCDGIKLAFRFEHFAENTEGYLVRRVFSFARDNIDYYVQYIESESIEKTVAAETACWEQQHVKRKNECLLLFIGRQGVTDNDRARLKELASGLVGKEEIRGTQQESACVVTLVDETIGEGYFLDTGGRMNISLNAHGCRMLKKCLVIK